MGVAVSSSHASSLPLLVPVWEDSSHSSLAAVWGPSRGRQSSMNFSSISPSHRLQFFTNCSSVGPFHRVQSISNTMLQHGYSMRSQVLPANVFWCGVLCLHGVSGPVRNLLQCWLSIGSQPPLGVPTCSGVGSFTGCTWISAPSWTSVGYKGENLPHHGLHHGLQGNLCSSA